MQGISHNRIKNVHQHHYWDTIDYKHRRPVLNSTCPVQSVQHGATKNITDVIDLMSKIYCQGTNKPLKLLKIPNSGNIFSSITLHNHFF